RSLKPPSFASHTGRPSRFSPCGRSGGAPKGAPRRGSHNEVAKNPDPLLPITSYAGKTRTLDDWATVFNLAIVVLPDRPEGASFVGIVERIFVTFGDSDVRTIICV